jgi:hypothetical protein
MKKMLLAGLLALAIAAGTQNVSAVNWVDAATSDNFTVDIDTDSIRTNGVIVSFWAKYNYNDGTYDLSFVHIDSADRTFAMVSGIRYDADGKVVASYNVPSYALEWMPIAPGTIMGILYNILFPESQY